MGSVLRTPENERAIYIQCDSTPARRDDLHPVLVAGTTAYQMVETLEVAWQTDKVARIRNDSFLFDAIVQRHKTDPLYLAFYDPEQQGYTWLEPLSFHQSYFHQFFDFAKTSNIYQFPGHFDRPANVAIFTQVYNESLMLKLWQKYYATIVEPQHLYVIDHGSTTDPRQVLSEGVNVITVPRGETDHRNIAHFCNQFHRFLLTHYKWVIHVDVDEILVHRNGFKPYLENLACTGGGNIISAADAYSIVHNVALEPPLDLDRPITLQRSHIVPDLPERKPVIASVPATWGMGFHFVLERDGLLADEDLWVMHLPYMDLDVIAAKNTKWNAIQFSRDCQTYGPHTVTPTAKDAVCTMLAGKLATEGATTIPDWMRGLF